MQSFKATGVIVPDETLLEYGEGLISFSWPDTMYGREGLTIELDGRCSRRMPMRSGYGLISVKLHRDCILLDFEATLACKLQLDERIQIEFQLSDADFSRLDQVVAEYLT